MRLKTGPAETASAYGALKAAFVPSPSTCAAAPDPASVVTTAPASMTRMRLLKSVSATKTLPNASAARPHTFEKRAAVPTPLLLPETPAPASVYTAPAGVTARTLNVW